MALPCRTTETLLSVGFQAEPFAFEGDGFARVTRVSLIDVSDKTPLGLVPVVPALLHYPKFEAVS